MKTHRHCSTVGLLGLSFLAIVVPARGAAERVLFRWDFDSVSKWNGWSPGGTIKNVEFGPAGVSFDALGPDPIIVGPEFELTPATNQQWVVIDLDCSAAGRAEFFFTNKTTGLYGGFEPKWVNLAFVPSAGRQSLTIWPFWGVLQKVIRIRFDPPSGVRCRLSSIRIVDASPSAGPPVWSFHDAGDPWRPMCASTVERTGEGLVVRASAPQASIAVVVAPFAAERRSILRLDARCPGEDVLGLYWATEDQPGLIGRPVPITGGDARSIELDLRCFPEWKGRVTHLALAFGTHGRETLTLRSMRIDENDATRPFLRLRHMGFERPVNRPGQVAGVRAILEHAGGPTIPAGVATFTVDENARCEKPSTSMPAIEPGKGAEVGTQIIPSKAGSTGVTLHANGQAFTCLLRIDEPITDPTLLDRGPDRYEVPKPRPVKTRYQIGIYYFPGWSPDQISRWEKQADFPERDPVLGWYKEGLPEVADWHIKWAVENAISFFVYDWYWRDGKEELGQGLNDGFLKARYRDYMKFAVMWANHPPFAGHTPDQLLAVTDYWLKHYFRQPNYLTIDGKPYVSFFSVHELLIDLGGPEKTKVAFDAMRRRVRDAGLAGLHLAACTGNDSHSIETVQKAGFDSMTAYNYSGAGATMPQSSYRSFLLGHESIWKAMRQPGVPPYVPLLTVGWDPRPWHGPRTNSRFARRTRDFAEALGRLKVDLDMNRERMAILEAWNEWGEGSYIEPNGEFGFSDLEAVRRTFAEPGDWPINVTPYDLGLGKEYDLRVGPDRSAHEGR